MKTVATAALAAALVAPVLGPAPPSAFSASASSVPIIPCSELPAYIRTAPARAVVQITGTCTNMELRNRRDPLTVIAGNARGPSATIVGLRLLQIQNLQWVGGVIEAIGGVAPTTNWQHERGLSVDHSHHLRFSGVTFRNAMRGATFTRSTNVSVVNSEFTRLRSDGVNLADVTGALVSGNRFTGFSPLPTTCTYPDGQVVRGLSRSACTAGGGSWVDGDHPDAVQMWGRIENVEVSRNQVFAPNPGWTQGITNFGTPTSTTHRVRVIANRVITDSSNGIVFLNCVDCVIRDNFVDKATTTRLHVVRLRYSGERVIACNNVNPDVAQNAAWALQGHEPCIN
ncbi:right-handed parallel beta-helix repeat-containing protein [Thermaurantiacus sp.]